ncbi:peptide ABC transporter substrate-binding protein [Aerococcus sp. 1KP-2016]|uniref:peptide ABC transporter substrate-binding protein n=1 Tax=Aerococcus sp. 1KP-2016 TaxID=1981982 RepID=UPI000B9995F7|nr:peptide ABC transporter substrate-binding protein [Aerococcus sp. 1KP-2016]OYQ68168.1 peptide ABC transporter substrate-binding protein [Aerococcus sp. 1KP-2016]
MGLKRSLIVTLATAALLAACGTGSETASSGTDGEAAAVVNYVAPTEIATMDSVMVTDMNSANYIGQVQDGLYWENDMNEIEPALAEALPEVSEDGLTYTIKMREDAKWSNGDPITANDFVYAIQCLANPDTAAPYSYLLAGFANSEAVLSGEAPVEELGVKALDDYTIEIQLDTPIPYIENLLAFTPLYPQNQAFVEEAGDAYGTNSDNIVFSGPFTMSNWDGTGLTWTLEKNADYYNADSIAIDEVNVQVIKEGSTAVNLFEAGDIDNAPLTGELAKQYQGDENAVQQAKARNYWMAFNYNNEVFQNQNLREAIDYAINNEELATNVIGDGSNAVATFVPENFIFNPETEEDFVTEVGITDKYDPEEAARLWDLAKEELGVETLDLNLLGDDDEKGKTTTQYIQGQVQNNLEGVTVNLQNVPKKNRLAQEDARDYDMVITGWAADFADGINFFELLETGGPYNRGDYTNTAYDAEIEAARGENANDPTARWANFVEAQNILVEDAAWVPLYQEVETQLRNPNLTGITFRSVGNEFDLRTATLEAAE